MTSWQRLIVYTLGAIAFSGLSLFMWYWAIGFMLYLWGLL